MLSRRPEIFSTKADSCCLNRNAGYQRPPGAAGGMPGAESSFFSARHARGQPAVEPLERSPTLPTTPADEPIAPAAPSDATSWRALQKVQQRRTRCCQYAQLRVARPRTPPPRWRHSAPMTRSNRPVRSSSTRASAAASGVTHASTGCPPLKPTSCARAIVREQLVLRLFRRWRAPASTWRPSRSVVGGRRLRRVGVDVASGVPAYADRPSPARAAPARGRRCTVHRRHRHDVLLRHLLQPLVLVLEHHHALGELRRSARSRRLERRVQRRDRSRSAASSRSKSRSARMPKLAASAAAALAADIQLVQPRRRRRRLGDARSALRAPRRRLARRAPPPTAAASARRRASDYFRCLALRRISRATSIAAIFRRLRRRSSRFASASAILRCCRATTARVRSSSSFFSELALRREERARVLLLRAAARRARARGGNTLGAAETR